VSLFVFGYGSLIWRPGFPHEARLPAVVEGFVRRLWQGSPDHRGTPERLGRVATLVRSPGGRCGGVVYRLPERDAEGILRALDHREKGGYARLAVEATLGGAARGAVQAITWIATPDNPHHLGPAPLADMVAQIRASTGPSGANHEYVIELDEALRALGLFDAHVAEIAAALAADARDVRAPAGA
jgi:glutathione-specific gamma-glutamylcyclotransferase